MSLRFPCQAMTSQGTSHVFFQSFSPLPCFVPKGLPHMAQSTGSLVCGFQLGFIKKCQQGLGVVGCPLAEIHNSC